MNNTKGQDKSTMLAIVRVAMLGGIVILGAVAIFLTKSGQVQPMADEILAPLRIAFVAILGIVVVTMFFFRKKRRALTPEDDPTTVNIIGWALGEAMAMFGAVILFLSGDLSYFFAGVVIMLVAFVFFPIPQE